MARRSIAAALLLVAVLTACSGDDGSIADRSPPVAQEPVATDVEVVDHELRLVDVAGSARVVARLDPESDGEVVHVSLRPGEQGSVTVLVLTRTSGDSSRYELRYLVADDRSVTDLYWFPWRLQVDEDLARVLDAPPLPVWSPDGGSLAWVEWDDEGTRLRTVGWRDDGVGSNPSDESSAYRLAGVPPGTQLQAWEVGSDGVPVLRGTDGDTVWRIRLDVGRGAVAMAERG